MNHTVYRFPCEGCLNKRTLYTRLMPDGGIRLLCRYCLDEAAAGILPRLREVGK